MKKVKLFLMAACALLGQLTYSQSVAPCSVNFRYCSSTDLPGVYDFTVNNPAPGAIYTWQFGDGTRATGADITYNYNVAGTYEVCVETVNPQTGQTCKSCTVICVREVSSCTVSFVTSTFRDRAKFGAQTGGLPVASYFWDFGDGNTSTNGPTVTHSYVQDRIYTVCLTIVYQNGCEARYCEDVIINSGIILDPAELKTSPGNITAPAAGIKVSPNPTGHSTVTATIDAAIAGTYRYVIYDVQGKPALTGSKGLTQGVQNIQLSVKELQPGKYWIEFSNSRQQLRTSFVKL